MPATEVLPLTTDIWALEIHFLWACKGMSWYLSLIFYRPAAGVLLLDTCILQAWALIFCGHFRHVLQATSGDEETVVY